MIQKSFFDRLAGSGSVEALTTVLAALRALGWVHQAHHWQTRGPQFYGDHLLFERLYGTVVEETDALAERAVGLLGIDAVSPIDQVVTVSNFVRHWCAGGKTLDPNMYAEVSLGAEKDFLNIVTVAISRMGDLTRGTDNLLADIEDKHEGHVYLLGQRTSQATWKA